MKTTVAGVRKVALVSLLSIVARVFSLVFLIIVFIAIMVAMERGNYSYADVTLNA